MDVRSAFAFPNWSAMADWERVFNKQVYAIV